MFTIAEAVEFKKRLDQIFKRIILTQIENKTKIFGIVEVTVISKINVTVFYIGNINFENVRTKF